MGISVDSNVINAYLRCLIHEETGDPAHLLIECIKTGPGFSIDEDDKIVHQWSETCKNKLFEIWLEEGIQAGNIRTVEHHLDEKHKKHLRINLGFPYRRRHEGVFIEVAAVTEERMIISEDIDFWSPRDKLSTPERRKEIMERGTGEVFRYLRTKVGVNVLTINLALDQLKSSSTGWDTASPTSTGPELGLTQVKAE
jgi:hypothetical protein